MKAQFAPRITTEGRTKLETVIPLSTPYLVFLDSSDICNARCPWCPTGSGDAKKYRKSQVMNFGLYKKIIDDLCEMPEKIKVLRLYKDGEPLLNRRFADMIGYAKESRRFGQIDTTTNGLLLTGGLSRSIVQAGLDKIFVSAPQNYDAKYIKKIEVLYYYSKNFGSCQVYVKILADGLEKERQDNFLQDFGDICDYISIEHLSPCWPEFNIGGIQSTHGIYGQELPAKSPDICPYIFYSLAVNSKGTVSLCFLDWMQRRILGDLRVAKFADVWNGLKLLSIRKVHLRGERNILPMCGDCQQLKYGKADNIDQYAEELLRKLE